MKEFYICKVTNPNGYEGNELEGQFGNYFKNDYYLVTRVRYDNDTELYGIIISDTYCGDCFTMHKDELEFVNDDNSMLELNWILDNHRVSLMDMVDDLYNFCT